MTARKRFSAGLLPFRWAQNGLQVFLVHMGGPLWEHKDDGAWSIAKGEYEPGDEHPEQVARREFLEEVGRPAPAGEFLDLGVTRLPSGKRVQAYAVETDVDLAFVTSNLFTMEWPPHSGRFGEFPEVDNAAWFTVDHAIVKIIASQVPIITALSSLVAAQEDR